MSYLVVLKGPPYGSERAYNGLRLVHALLKNDPEADVAVFLMADAVVCGKQGQKTPEGYYNIERMLKRVSVAGGRVLACGTCLDARGITEAEVMEVVHRSPMDELVRETAEADKVPVF